MTTPIAIIDAFTATPFSGNPAAVCLLPVSANPCDGWMQSVAAEMNLSETAFLHKNKEGEWQLRWFTPTTEVDLCGHATLAAAHALWNIHHETLPTLSFSTRSGLLTATKTTTGISLSFPVTTVTKYTNPIFINDLTKTLGITTTALPIWQAGDDLLVEFDHFSAVESLHLQQALLITIPCRGLIVTAAGGRNEVDFTSRFFAPNAGIPEDPVTGSAHCALAHYWSTRLNKTAMRAYQASARGGYINIELKNNRVFLQGQATTVLKGALCADYE